MKFKRLFLLLFFVGFPVFAEYQQQGFTQFQAFDGNIEFACEKECFALIGPMAGSDYVTLQGNFEGTGIVGYGFIVGQQIIPGHTFQVQGGVAVDQQFSFSELPFYSQLPAEAQLVIVVQGTVMGNQVRLDPGFMTFYARIGQGWKDFWKAEPYGFYSINLLYGPKIIGESATKKFSIWFIILSIILFIYLVVNKKKQKKFKTYFVYLSVILFLILGIRFVLIDAYGIVKTDYKTFISQPDEKKIFRNYNDIYAFDQFIRNNIEKGSVINFISYQEWPFVGFSEYQLRPDIQFNTGANILAVYDVGTMKVESGMLINIQDGTVLATGLYDIKYFSSFSFIAKK